MRKKRRKFGSAFKSKVAIEALKERKTLAELALKYELHPNQISQWKQEFIEKSSLIFESKQSKTEDSKQIDTEKLYSKIGQLEMENDFLKKNLKKLGL